MTDIAGTWMLVRTSATSAEGQPVPQPYGGEHAMGRLVLTSDGRMMAVLCDGRRAVPPGERREYSSYCGNYTFDGKRLVTRVDAADKPERIGSDQIRDIRFDGELMVLMPPVRKYGDLSVQRELFWKRISSV